MIKPVTKYQPAIPRPELLGKLSPELQVVEVGYTPLNLMALACLLGTSTGEVCDEAGVDRELVDSALNLEAEVSYLDFIKLCRCASEVIPGGLVTIRESLPEFGYSPYNLAVMEYDLGFGQADFADMLGWSISKLRQHIPANTDSSQYKPMKIGDWVYAYGVYEAAVLQSDLRFKTIRDNGYLFYEGSKGLAAPTIPTEGLLQIGCENICA